MATRTQKAMNKLVLKHIDQPHLLRAKLAGHRAELLTRSPEIQADVMVLIEALIAAMNKYNIPLINKEH